MQAFAPAVKSAADTAPLPRPSGRRRDDRSPIAKAPLSMTASAAFSDRTQALRGHAAMLLFAVAISGSFSFGARAAQHLAPEAIGALRFALAGAVLGAAAALTAGGLRRAQLAAPWRYAALGAPLAVYFVTQFAALRLADPVAVAAVFTLTPLMAAGFGWWLLRQRTDARMAGALALGAAGAVWVIFGADLERLAALRLGPGETLFLFGCAAHALYTPLVRKLNRGESPMAFSFWTALAAGAGLLGASVVTGGLDWGAMAAEPPILWVAIAYLALVATALTFVLMQYAALRLPAAKVMAYGYLVPGFTALWEGLFGFGWAAPGVLAGVAATGVAMLLLLRD